MLLLNYVYLVNLELRDNLKFLKPNNSKRKPGTRRTKRKALHQSREIIRIDNESNASFDIFYHPIFAAGQCLITGMLDSILFHTFINISLLDIFKLFCGLKYELDFQLDHELGIEPAYFLQIPVPVEFVGKTYGDLFYDLSKRGLVPLGLFRSPDVTLGWGNKLGYNYTNPIPCVQLYETDKLFILSPDQK